MKTELKPPLPAVEAECESVEKWVKVELLHDLDLLKLVFRIVTSSRNLPFLLSSFFYTFLSRRPDSEILGVF